MNKLYLHYAMGFGAHKGRQLSKAQLISFATANKYCPDYEIVMHTLQGTYLNAPANVTRNEVDENWASNWPKFNLVRGEHMSDKVRLSMLKQYGGLYTDCDQWFINSPNFAPLQGLDKLWMGRWSISSCHLLCGFMYAGKPNCSAIDLWIKHYEQANGLTGWQTESCLLPSKLAKENPAIFDVSLYESPWSNKPGYAHGAIKRSDLASFTEWPIVNDRGLVVHCTFQGRKEPSGPQYELLLQWLEQNHC